LTGGVLTAARTPISPFSCGLYIIHHDFTKPHGLERQRAKMTPATQKKSRISPPLFLLRSRTTSNPNSYENRGSRSRLATSEESEEAREEEREE
jgi:hypothetical protein